MKVNVRTRLPVCAFVDGNEACGFAFDMGMRIGELESLLDALY